MNKLLKAIETEREYLDLRLKGEEPWHFVDKVKELGFSDLEDYFKEKRKFLFNQISFEYLEKYPSECIKEVLRMINEKVTGVLFVNSSNPFIFCGNDCDYDEEYCKENNISVYPIFTNGGCIVSSPGDFSLGICVPNSEQVDCEYILQGICNIMCKYNDNVSVDGNDILINGKKVLGSAHYQQNGMFMFVAHMSFSDSSALVKRICKKTSLKEPGYIVDMTREQFRCEVESWLLK